MTTGSAATLGLLLAATPLPAAEPVAPVAIVAGLRGEAGVRVPGEAERPLRLFEWLRPGAAVRAGTGSTLVLAFLDGSRRELSAGARAALGPAGLAQSEGPVRALAGLPALPEPPALLPSALEGTRAGAIRIRSGGLTGLYPRHGWPIDPEAPALAFEPATGASRYAVEVEDESGRRVHADELAAPPLALPAGLLRPGARYYWRVRTLDTVGTPARGEAEFSTLTEPGAARLRALRAELAAGDGAALGLLAAVERGLGLLAPARERLRRALESEDAPALRELLAEVEAALAEPRAR